MRKPFLHTPTLAVLVGLITPSLSGAPELVVNPGLKTAGMDSGELLLGELACVRCHQADAELAKRLFTKTPPLLEAVGSRITPNYLREFLTNPQVRKPGTGMPDVLHAVDQDTKARTVSDLVHFLASQRRETEHPGVEADAYLLENGRRLYHSVGCVACHDAQEGVKTDLPETADATERILRQLKVKGRKDAEAVPLPSLAQKTTVGELARFLQDPLKVRPSGRMPSLNLTPNEAKSIAMYLLREQLTAPGAPEPELIEGLKYTYYEANNFHRVADVLKSEPKLRGSTTRITNALRKRDQNYGIVFQGVIVTRQAGKYTFHTSSDDGSMLWIGERLVVNNDGDHGTQHRKGEIELGAGQHPIRIGFYNHGGPHALKVEWEGPGFSRREIESSSLAHLGQPMRPLGWEEFEVDPERAEAGRAKFVALGCATCHDLEKVESQVSPPTMAALRPERGCLSEDPAATAPRFALSSEQRRALREVVRKLHGKKGAVALAPEERLRRSLAAHNCYACHARGKIGGPGPKRSDYFIAAMKADLGDEARFPPDLDGVGGKLRKSWLNRVLTAAGTTRPYIATRMPQFGTGNVGELAEIFATVDVREPVRESPTRFDLFRHGRTLVGNKGFSCITCHRYGKYESLGIPAADLAQMTKRVRKEWFREFLLNPQGKRPGTRMPEFWPAGKSIRPEVLEGDTGQQIEALWAYLAKGPSNRLPFGLKRVGQELIPEDDPLIYRHFIQGGGTRAIGVGYPEEIHLAWDANEQRLAMIWRGGFIDAGKHRSGRGAGWEGPLGDDVIQLVGGPPLAVLSSPDAPWPQETGKKAGFRTRGYRLDKKRRPTFFYDFKGARVDDFPMPVEVDGEAHFVRTLTVSAEDPIPGLWFRAAAVGEIAAASANAASFYRIDGKYSIRLDVPRDVRPVVRRSGGKEELLVPVVFEDGKATIVEVLGW